MNERTHRTESRMMGTEEKKRESVCKCHWMVVRFVKCEFLSVVT